MSALAWMDPDTWPIRCKTHDSRQRVLCNAPAVLAAVIEVEGQCTCPRPLEIPVCGFHKDQFEPGRQEDKNLTCTKCKRSVASFEVVAVRDLNEGDLPDFNTEDH